MPQSVNHATETVPDEAWPVFHLRNMKGMRGWLWLIKRQKQQLSDGSYISASRFTSCAETVLCLRLAIGMCLSAGIFTVWLTFPRVTSPVLQIPGWRLVESHTALFSPGRRTVFIFDFTLFQLFSLFSLLFSCLLQSSLFKPGWGKGDTQLWTRHTAWRADFPSLSSSNSF